MKIKYPKNLETNGTIGVTATSAGVTEEDDIKRLEYAYQNLKELGFNIIETSNGRKNKQFVSSSGKERADEFLELWQNKQVNLIAQVRGGEFLMEMLPYLSSESILNHEPKYILGYSDSSLLNFYLTTKLHF